MTFAQLAGKVRNHLGQQHRYAHCIRVARMAENLARTHGEDAAKARLAGMLHDLARLYPAGRLIEECERRGVPIDDFARENPVVLHAPLSAELAREDFGIEDPAVLSAIAKHTLGSGQMSALDCIVYLADSLEPGRSFADRAELADLAGRDLFRAMLATIESSLRYLKQSRIAPQTAQALAVFNKWRFKLADILDIVRDAALDKKAEDLTEIDVAGRTIIADTFVVLTGRSKIQTRSIADAIAEKIKGSGLPVSRMEGYSDGNWILIDLGPVVVHVFTPEQRAFYNLERLWSAAPQAQAQSS